VRHYVSTVGDFVHDCQDGTDEVHCGECDFNHGSLCGWSTVGTADKWVIINPASISPDSMPKVDGEGKAEGGFVTIFAPGRATTSAFGASSAGK